MGAKKHYQNYDDPRLHYNFLPSHIFRYNLYIRIYSALTNLPQKHLTLKEEYLLKRSKYSAIWPFFQKYTPSKQKMYTFFINVILIFA